MQLTSSAFESGANIPKEYTCQGRDTSPPLKWSGIPEGTESLALSCLDPDAPGGEFSHWLVHTIPAQEKSVEAEEKLGGVEVENDFGKPDYGGPCPPSGKHCYIFTLYALNVEGLVGVTKENFKEKVEAVLIEKTELIGFYQKE